MTSRADSAAGLASVSPKEFRDALARWGSGVTIVTARGRDDEPIGMTASSFSALSLDPPLVLVCVGRIAQSHDALVEAAGFAVHILGADQADMAELFAIPGADKFGEFPEERGLFDAPLVPFDVARLLVAHHAAFDGGDHTILVGRVVATELAGTDPLMHFHRGYRRLA